MSHNSTRHTLPEIVDDLRKVLGARLVAYVTGVSETRTIREWAEATRRPRPAAEDRLRLAHRVVRLIGHSEGEAIVPIWFQGMNPQLGDRSPARVLHEDSFDEAGARVLAAANAFVGATDGQQAAVERVISRRFESDQINAPTIAPNRPSASGREHADEARDLVEYQAAKSDLRPGLRAYEDSVRLPFPELVDELREIIGARLVAYIGGVMSTMSVSAWARGTEAPDEVDRERLRHAYHVAALLRERYDAITVQSWFKGRNPSLDTVPAHVLREGDPLKGARDVIAAAKAFAYIG